MTARQAAYRARQAAQQPPEVRGIFAHPADHAAIKAAAARLAKQRAKTLPYIIDLGREK